MKNRRKGREIKEGIVNSGRLYDHKVSKRTKKNKRDGITVTLSRLKNRQNKGRQRGTDLLQVLYHP